MRRRRKQRLPQAPIILDIEKLSHEGRGIAHLNGKVIFVEEALAGEKVEAQYTSRRDSFDQAKTLTVLQPAPERVEPRCQYAGICGGCSLQHFEASAQLNFKQTVLHEKLGHSLGREDYKKLDALEGPVFAYRRKARLAVRHVEKKQKVLVGFREKHSTFITDMESCAVLDLRVSQLIPALSSLIESLDSSRYIPQIEVAAGDPQSEGSSCALIFRHLQPLNAADLHKLTSFAETHQFDLYLQSGGLDSVIKQWPVDTPDRLYYQLPDFGLTLAFHPMDFTQVNAGINQLMISRAVSLLEVNSGDRILDLFCGLGNFTLPLATQAAFVSGVEGSEEMVKRGEENARRNSLDNVAFYSADLSKDIGKESWLKPDINKILLDPPRSGALEILPAIIKLQSERIVYISCNPATLARDAAELEKLGYGLAAAGVMDMFPQTTHVESIALFLPLK